MGKIALTQLAADPGVEIQWSEIERGHWVAECVCGTEHYHEPRTRPAPLDPLDPKTIRHLPQCEFAAATDPAVLRVLLKVKPGLSGGYHWVECGACDAGGRLRTTPRSSGDWRGWNDDNKRRRAAG